MNILGISAAYMGIFIKSIIGFKGKKDHISIFKLDVVIINIKKGGDNNPSNFNNNKNYKKIKISKPNKYYNK